MTAAVIVVGLLFGYAASWLLVPLIRAAADVLDELF